MCSSFDSIAAFFEALIVSFRLDPLFFSLAPLFRFPQKANFSHFPLEKGHLGTNYCVLSVAVDVVPLIVVLLLEIGNEKKGSL